MSNILSLVAFLFLCFAVNMIVEENKLQHETIELLRQRIEKLEARPQLRPEQYIQPKYEVQA